ncbi:MAG: TIGR02147 family protein, partial [Fibrobacter sp.]|nr:TIGR02147 family protein [Fibrobacter sp.]
MLPEPIAEPFTFTYVIGMQRIENYDNYRDFLKDYFQDRKKRFPYFSNRYFCQKSGIKSPSLFQEVVEGKRNLTQKTIAAFIKGMDLTDRDAAFFTILVHLNQAKTSQERDFYLSQLKNLKQKVQVEVVPADHYEYYSRWYNPAIRELCCIVKWNDDYELLGSLLQPPLKAKDAKESVELLLRLGFLTKDESGNFTQTSPAI